MRLFRRGYGSVQAHLPLVNKLVGQEVAHAEQVDYSIIAPSFDLFTKCLKFFT